MIHSSSTILLYALGILISFLAVLTTRAWLRLQHIPGPFSAGFSNWWQLKHSINGRLHLEMAETCEKYGMVSVCEGIIVVS